MAKIIFMMGVAGSGKTTVLNESGLLKHPNIIYVPSFTTRAMRPGEINGEKYIHIHADEFQQKIDSNDFLECALVHQMAMYGTDYTTITAPLTQGKCSIKELEIYGLIAIQESKRIDNQYITLFLDIPIDLMTQRILQRQTIHEDELQKRIASATFEKEQAQLRCTHIIDATQPLEAVCKEVKQIIETTCF